MSKKPLVSILIASFNKDKYTERCIISCLKQSYKKIEIIFYDDGSSDNSITIAKKFNKLKKINILQNKKKRNLQNLIHIHKLIVIARLLQRQKELL